MCSTHNHDLQSSGMAMGRKGLTQVRLSRNDWARCSSATYRQHAHLPTLGKGRYLPIPQGANRARRGAVPLMLLIQAVDSGPLTQGSLTQVDRGF
jgi:hypothetical protein